MMLIQELTTYCTLFQGMQPETVKDLLDRYGYALRSYPEQSFLAMQGEMCRSLFILCHGHINALMINHEGRQIIVEQFTDWSVLAPAFLLATHNVFPVNIETTSPCEVLVLNKDTLLKMLHADLRMMENFLREISDKCPVWRWGKKIHGSVPNRVRLALLLRLPLPAELQSFDYPTSRLPSQSFDPRYCLPSLSCPKIRLP